MLSRTWWLLDNFIVCCRFPQWSHLPLCGHTAHIPYSSSPLRVPLSPWCGCATPSAVSRNCTRKGKIPLRSSLSQHSRLCLVYEPFILLSVVHYSKSLPGSAVLLLRCLASWFTVHVCALKCLHPANPTSCRVPLLDGGASYFLFVPEQQFPTGLPADSKGSKPSQITYVQAQLRPAIWKFGKKKISRYKNVKMAIFNFP